MEISDIKIDPEFQGLLRPHNDEERKAMKESVDAHGYVAPIIVWKGNGLCVDGHHRLADYTKRVEDFNAQPKPGMFTRLVHGAPAPPDPPAIKEMEFADRAAVMEFIAKTQQSRRNLTELELSRMRYKFYRKQCESVPKMAATQATANEYKVSPSTVARDKSLGEAVDTMAPLVAEITGQNLEVLILQQDGIQREAIMDAAKMVTENGATTEVVQRAVEMATTPGTKVRMDEAHEPVKVPAWEKGWQSFERACRKEWEAFDVGQRQAVRARIRTFVKEMFPEPKPVVRGPVKGERNPLLEGEALST